MGTHSSHIPPCTWTADHLSEVTGLSNSELDQFYSEYVNACKQHGEMNLDKFIQLYSHLPFVNARGVGNMKDRANIIFHAFDRDCKGILTFDEFISAIILMNYEINQNNRNHLSMQENEISKHEENDYSSSPIETTSISEKR